MAPVESGWKELVEAHWDLFYPPAAAPGSPRGYPECGEGRHALLDRACVQIGGALAEGHAFQVVQIKQKLGTFRIYRRGRLSDETKVQEAEELAEARSGCTCEVCGVEGRCTALAAC